MLQTTASRAQTNFLYMGPRVSMWFTRIVAMGCKTRQNTIEQNQSDLDPQKQNKVNYSTNQACTHAHTLTLMHNTLNTKTPTHTQHIHTHTHFHTQYLKVARLVDWREGSHKLRRSSATLHLHGIVQ